MQTRRSSTSSQSASRRYRREDSVATRHAPSLPTHITTLDGHDLVKQWATWNAERPPTVERARLAKRPKPREYARVASRPADRLGRQMIKRYGNLPWARPETPPVVEDAAAVQRRAEMEEEWRRSTRARPRPA